jgi:large subunit ribosomal protein L17
VRHRKGRTHLGRTTAHFEATMSNMLAALIEHGRIRTTETKARELRRHAERAVSRATRLGDILLKDRGKLDQEDKARFVHAVRLAKRRVRSRDAVLRLFDEWAPRYLGRPGGYTRMLKLGNRRGDNAPMALLEFVPADMPAREQGSTKDETKEKRKKRGFLGRGKETE